jgi:xylulokinase
VNELLLGVDVGSSSTKGVLVDGDGRVVCRAQRSHAMAMPAPGRVEHDAETVWWRETVEVCRELTGAGLGTVVACGVSGIGPCVLPTDAAGTPLRPAILYGIDTRATSQIDALDRELGRDAILARCGSVLTTQSPGPKILWLREHEPEVWARTQLVFSCNSFLVHRLTGSYVLDHHSASQFLPLYDFRAETWIDEWAERVAPTLRLPHLLWPSEIAGVVNADAAAATGIPQGTPVVAGTIDAWSEALSVGVSGVGETMLMYGTTFFITSYVESPTPDARVWLTKGVFPGTATVAAGMSTGGALLGWLEELVGIDAATILAEIGRIAPGADGLLALPYFAGERSPIFDPAARGVVVGLGLHHGRAHLGRALLEAAAYGVRHNLELMENASGEPWQLVGVGGGIRGGVWPQIVCDVTGLRQRIPAETIGASFGDALLAAIGTGRASSDTRWARVARVLEPQPAAKDRYDRLFDLYKRLYPATRDVVHELAALQEGLDAAP